MKTIAFAAAASFFDASKIAVGENATVTLEGDLICTATTGEFGRIDGIFAVTGSATVESGAALALAGAGAARLAAKSTAH